MPLVSILIPVKNEEKYIEKCLKSVIQFQHPRTLRFEILVLDGISTDKTPLILKKYANKYKKIKVFRNNLGIQSAAINLGLRKSFGEWILRLDAHAEYPLNYLRLCYETAMRTHADNIGGIFITKAGGPNYSAQLVQALTTHKFGVGDSGFRTEAKEDWADTVPYGFFRRKIFDQIGWLDERLVRAQDYEFNRRLIAAGGRIFRNPDIQIHYFNQPSLSAFYRKQFFLEAPYNAYMWYVAPYSFTLRHAITGFFVVGVLGGIVLGPIFPKAIGIPFFGVMALYLTLAVLSSIQQAVRYKEIRHIFVLPLAFSLYHFIHGLGLLAGLLRLATFTAPVQKINEPWPGAGFYRVPIRKGCLSKDSADKNVTHS
jgi:glycosyltransferase involved in cell wall biosynthesis